MRIALPKGLNSIEDGGVFDLCDSLTDISFGGSKDGFMLLTHGAGITVNKSTGECVTPKIYFMDLKNEI